jgi:hypothetical protein
MILSDAASVAKIGDSEDRMRCLLRPGLEASVESCEQFMIQGKPNECNEILQGGGG